MDARSEESGAQRPYTTGYDPPASTDDPRPRVLFWYRVYAATMMLASGVFLAIVAFAAWAHAVPRIAVRVGAAQAQPEAIVMFLVAVTALGFYATATFMPLKPWAWTFGLVVIALGLPGLTIAFCLPMFFAWMKPSVKAAFRRL